MELHLFIKHVLTSLKINVSSYNNDEHVNKYYRSNTNISFQRVFDPFYI